MFILGSKDIGRIYVNRGRSRPGFIVGSLLPRLTRRRSGHALGRNVGNRRLGILINDRPFGSSRKDRLMGLGVLGLLGRGCNVYRTSFLSTRLSIIPTFGTSSVNFSHSLVNNCKRSSHIYTFPTLATVLGIRGPGRATVAILTSGRRVNSVKGANLRDSFLQCMVNSLTGVRNNSNAITVEGSGYLSTSIGTTLSPAFPSIVRHGGTDFIGCNIIMAGCANTENGSNADSTDTRCVTRVHGLLSSGNVV